MDIKRDIQAVVIDLDGTLLNNKHSLSDTNKAAILKTIEQGVKVFLATGKTRVSAESVIAALALDTPGVFVQGLIIYNADGSIRNQSSLERVAARRVIQYAELEGFTVIAYSGNRLVTKRLNESARKIAEFGEPIPEGIGSLVNHVDNLPMHKLIILDDDKRRLRALRWQLDQQIGDQVSFTESGAMTSLEVLPKGASKGNGVKALMRQMNILPEKVMAIGDADNDIEMLKWAGFAVAVENATEALKAVASEIVKSNDNDGVADALEKFVLKKEVVVVSEPETKPSEAKMEAEEPKTEGDQ
jgi:Cof subfamily protein (haloacid dehalogenase superfamily)